MSAGLAQLFAELVCRVGAIVVATDGKHRDAVEVLEADRVLITALLLLFVDVELSAAVERVIKTMLGNILGDYFQLAHGALLQCAQLWVADLTLRNYLCNGVRCDRQDESQEWNLLLPIDCPGWPIGRIGDYADVRNDGLNTGRVQGIAIRRHQCGAV